MKSLVKWIASIGIFSLVLAGSSATAQAQNIDPSVHAKKAVVALWNVNQTSVLVEVTAVCGSSMLPATGTVSVAFSQTAAQSNANTAATSSSAMSSVKCDGKPRTVAVAFFLNGANVGKATVTTNLTLMAMVIATESNHNITVGFPATENGDEEGD